MSTPLPPARPSALSTTGKPYCLMALRASSAVGQTSASAVGMLWRRKNSLENTFDDSICAARRDGPKIGRLALDELVGDAERERQLRPDDRQVDVELLGEVRDLDDVARTRPAGSRRPRRCRGCPARRRSPRRAGCGAATSTGHARALPRRRRGSSCARHCIESTRTFSGRARSGRRLRAAARAACAAPSAPAPRAEPFGAIGTTSKRSWRPGSAMSVSSDPWGASSRPKRPRARTRRRRRRRARASKASARPDQVRPPRLSARTRQTVTWSLEVYGSRTIVRRTSTQGESGGSAASRRREKARIGIISGSFRRSRRERPTRRGPPNSRPFVRRALTLSAAGFTVPCRSLSRPDRRRVPAASRVGEGPARRPHGNQDPRVAARLDRCQIRNSPEGEEDEGRREHGPHGPAPLASRGFFVGRQMKKDFRKTIAEEVLLADGAIGTLLTSRGASPDQARSPLNLSDPDVRARGPRRLRRRGRADPHDEHVGRQPRQAHRPRVGRLAREDQPRGRAPRPGGRRRRARLRRRLDRARSARSSSRTARCTSSQVREIFEEQARVLLESGVDLILLETFGSLLEAAEAVRAVRGLSVGDPDRRAR